MEDEFEQLIMFFEFYFSYDQFWKKKKKIVKILVIVFGDKGFKKNDFKSISKNLDLVQKLFKVNKIKLEKLQLVGVDLVKLRKVFDVLLVLLDFLLFVIQVNYCLLFFFELIFFFQLK